jgi:hypothetical protein
MKNRASVKNLKSLVKKMWEMEKENNAPMNPTLYFDDEYNFSIESDLYSHEDQYEWGRLCDSFDWFGVDIDESLTTNLKNIDLAVAMTVTECCNNIIDELE